MRVCTAAALYIALSPLAENVIFDINPAPTCLGAL